MTNITAYKGLPLSIFVELDSDSGSVFDSTQYTYKGEIRSHVDGSLYGTLTVTGCIDNYGQAGVQVSLSAVDSALIPYGIYAYSILATETATGNVSLIFNGDFVQANPVTAP